MKADLRPGDMRSFGGDKAIAMTFGVWAKKQGNWIEIHMTGNNGHTWVTNNPSSIRYHRTLFRNLRRALIENDKWQFANMGAETEIA